MNSKFYQSGYNQGLSDAKEGKSKNYRKENQSVLRFRFDRELKEYIQGYDIGFNEGRKIYYNDLN